MRPPPTAVQAALLGCGARVRWSLCSLSERPLLVVVQPVREAHTVRYPVPPKVCMRLRGIHANCSALPRPVVLVNRHRQIGRE